jgi:sterol 3beta-glucosyltransferase
MARRISILTVGTLGDVAPMVVLGRALADLGYAVSVAAPDNFRHLIEGMGLEARRCGSDFSTLMKEEEVGSLTGARTLKQLLAWRFPGPKVRAMFEGVLRDAVAASADADAIIFHPYISIACDIAEARRIPAILVPLGLISPSAETALAVLPRPTSPMWNRLSYSLFYLQRNAYQSTINDIRRRSLGLGRGFRYKHPHKVRGQPVTAIYPVSAALAPCANSIDENIHFTGYWFRDDEPHWQPSPRLAEFLSGTPRPIYIGFGSMPYIGKEPTEMLLAACEAAGQRAVLGKGWGAFFGSGETSLSENFHVLGYAPHLRLFREVSAVVHHGGLGTTSAGLMAGRPTLVCPFWVDQPYWGHHVAQLGAGPQPLPITDWTLERLTAAIRDLVSNPLYRTRAAEIAAKMRHEGGSVAAARIVQSIIGAPDFAPREALLGVD